MRAKAVATVCLKSKRKEFSSSISTDDEQGRNLNFLTKMNGQRKIRNNVSSHLEEDNREDDRTDDFTINQENKLKNYLNRKTIYY